MVTKRVPRDERLHLRYLKQLTNPPNQQKSDLHIFPMDFVRSSSVMCI
jgi:hypothetical protein